MSADITKDLNFEVVKDSVIGTLKNFAVLNGRARRREFWLFFLASFVVGCVVGWIPVIGWLVTLALCIPSFTAGVRRLHDTDRSGWTELLALIPIAGIIILIVFWVQEGTEGENKYGPDPKGGEARAKAAPATASDAVCPSCGKKNPSGAKFCNKCGAKF